MQLQLKDAEERETNFKKMNETMIQALRNEPADKNSF